MDSTDHQLTLTVSSTQTEAHCPVCQAKTHRVHSHYQRTLRDLPCVDFSLIILLQVSRFFCPNEACKRRIFTERLPQIAVPWARKTVRFAEHLSSIGLALGGAAAARLSYQINYGSSRNIMLRAIAKLPLPPVEVPKTLGVDDFALHKGQNYGTILVNLEQHKPIALLPDREAETLANWLKEHPGVEVLSRDRSKTYKSAMCEAAPNAIQVADRFHLLKNLQEVLEKVLHTQTQALKSVETDLLDLSAVKTPAPKPTDDEQKARNRARRLEKYEQTHALKKQWYRPTDIAHHLGICRRTVYQYLSHPVFPERQYIHKVRDFLGPYKAYLSQEWMAGRHNSRQLFEEIQEQGFKGSYGTVARYTR